MEGGSGVLHLPDKTVLIKKPVVISMKDYELRTNSLRWSSKDETITSKDDISLSGDNFFITGNGLSVNVKNETLILTQNVKASISQ